MSALALYQLLRAHLPRVLHIPTQAEQNEAYLDESVDLCDLERRLHEVEARGRADTDAPSFH
jgi:hypothetical protein